MKPIVILVLLLCLSTTVVFGQIKIGDNPQNIDPSSVLELESSSRVLVITRVNTTEMAAITPQRGGVVYNTDTECMHYYNGTAWINLCDAVSFSLTNDPIENVTSTISIVDNGATVNLEVAQNSIRSENIVDGGINGDDIQDNSIGESKLGNDSVSSNELRDGSVGSSELIDGSIQPIDIANTLPNQVLITDINGFVAWDDASNLRGAVADETTITGAGTVADPLALTVAVTTSISDNAAAILNETTRATNAELANANAIAAEETRAVDAEQVNADAIVAETTRATNAELANATDITTEETRAVAAEQANTNAITAETTRATAAETLNANNITSIQTDKEDVINKDPNTNLGTSDINYPTQNAVKTYVDAQVGGVTTDDDITNADLNPLTSVLTIEEGATAIDVSLADLEESQAIVDETQRATLAENTNASDITALQNDKEDVTNKNPNINLGTSNTDYPTQNAVKVYVDSEIADIVASGGSDPINEENQTFEVAGGELRITDIAGTLSIPLTNIDTNTQLTDADITALGYIKTPDEQSLTELLIVSNNAGGTTITNLPLPSIDSDAATKAYVDGAITGVGGTIVSTQPNNNITDNLGAFYNDPDNNPTNEIQNIGEVLIDGNDAGGELIKNIADPIDPQDAATRAYVLANNSGAQNLSQVLIQGNNAGGVQIENLIDPDDNQDAATKKYVDDTVVAAGGGIPTDELITAFNLSNTTLTITENGFDWDLDLDPSFVSEAEFVTKEDIANKSNDPTLVDNSATDFPTEQAVKTYVDTQIGAIAAPTIVSADTGNSISASGTDGGAFYDDSALTTATTTN
ncbi:MAG: hypothetical protein ACJA1P_000737, partial [Maribacter sp.]